MNTRNKLPGKFVPFYVNLSLLFDSAEVVFILHLVDMENMKRNGYSTAWSRDFVLLKMNLGIRLFERCVKRLISIGLLSRKLKGHKYIYTLDMELYEKLVGIFTITNDIHKMKSFCDTVFVKQKKKIQDITEEDLKELGKGLK